MTASLRDPGPADQPLRSGGSPRLTVLAQFLKIFPIIFALSGCVQLPLRTCVGLDVASTVVGVKMGLIREANPLWRASVGAGHYLPFVLASVGLVMLVEWIDRPVVTEVVAGVECGLGARNLWLMR